MKTIISLKDFSGQPTDGIDNVNKAVFSRLNPDVITFYAGLPKHWQEQGSIKRLPISGFLGRISFIRKIKPDYVLGIGTVAELWYLLFKPKKTKYCIVWHTVLFRAGGPWKVRTPWWLRRLIFKQADLVIAVSDYAASSVRVYFPQLRVVAIKNGMECELFSPSKKDSELLRSRYSILTNKPIFSFVGSLHSRKRPELFIALAKRFPGATFVLVGRAVPEHPLTDRIKNIANVRWIEQMPREHVAVLLAASRGFIFPSLHEAAAAVILEAMASGCPPVVSKSGGSPEFVIDGESGFLIDEGAAEFEDFCLVIKTLLENGRTYQQISKKARFEAVQRTWDVAAKEYEQLLLS